MVIYLPNSRNSHQEYVVTSGQTFVQGTVTFLHTKGGQYLPAAIKLFQAKTLSQLTYGTILYPPSSCFTPSEQVQTEIFESIIPTT